MYKSNLNKYCFSKWKWLNWLDYFHLRWTQKRVTRSDKSIVILFYGIFKKYLAFFKQNRKDNYVFVMIWRVLRMAEGKTEIIWWTWQKKMDLYIPWRSQSQIKVILDIHRSQGRNSDLQEKQILQLVIYCYIGTYK